MLTVGSPAEVNLATDTAQRRWPLEVLQRVHGRTGRVQAVVPDAHADLARAAGSWGGCRLRVVFDMPVRFFHGGEVWTSYDFRPEDLAEVRA